MHQFIQKARIKNNLPAIDIKRIGQYALPETAYFFLNEIEVWSDDRFKAVE